MRLEDLHDRFYGDGTLRGGYAVVWDGTKSSDSQSKYLGAEDHEVRDARSLRRNESTFFTDRVIDYIETHGPSPIRDVAVALDVETRKVKSAMCSLKACGVVNIVAMRAVGIDKFGVRRVAVYGIAS